VIANVRGDTDDYIFEWYRKDNPGEIVFTGSDVATLDTATYQVIATDIESGCISETAEVTIENGIVDPEFKVNVSESLCLRTEDGSTNQFSGKAFIEFAQPTDIDAADTTDYIFTSIESIQWMTLDGFVISEDLQFVDASPGDYSVTFTTDKGCTYSATFTVEPTIRIYNGLSANNDGLNDFFLLDCLDLFPNNKVSIFTRNGTLVWESEEYDNRSVRWDGFSNVGSTTRKLPVGTYFFVIDKGDGSDFLQGYVELVR